MCSEKLERLNELRAAKTQYRDGYWNCNAVLLGGLGKDPDVDDDDDRHSKAASTTDADSKQTRSGRSGRLVVSRKSSRREDSDVSPKRYGGKYVYAIFFGGGRLPSSNVAT